MDAPTISELKAVSDDGLTGLLQFLASLPTSREAAVLYAALFIALPLGFIASWAIKWGVAKTIDDTLISYFFKSHARRTFGAIISYVGIIVAAISTGVFDHNGSFTGWYNVFSFCLSAAMAADGTINKGTQGAWTPAQREAERESRETPPSSQ